MTVVRSFGAFKDMIYKYIIICLCFQDIYQPSTSNYERVSPVDDYQSAAAGHSANPLQSFGGFRADGSHLLQVQRAPVISVSHAHVPT